MVYWMFPGMYLRHIESWQQTSTDVYEKWRKECCKFWPVNILIHYRTSQGFTSCFLRKDNEAMSQKLRTCQIFAGNRARFASPPTLSLVLVGSAEAIAWWPWSWAQQIVRFFFFATVGLDADVTIFTICDSKHLYIYTKNFFNFSACSNASMDLNYLWDEVRMACSSCSSLVSIAHGIPLSSKTWVTDQKDATGGDWSLLQHHWD